MADETVNHLAAILKSVVATTPVGSAIVTAINEYVPSAHDQALRQAAQALKRDMERLETRMNVDFVRTDEFADLFKNCVIVMQRTQHPEKLDAAASILTNYLLQDGDDEKRPYNELDHFTHCIEMLSLEAIRVLRESLTVAKKNKRGSRNLKIENIPFPVRSLQSATGIDENLLMGLLGELNSFNLLHGSAPPSTRHGGNLYGNYSYETTPLGYRFVTYILESGSGTEDAKE